MRIRFRLWFSHEVLMSEAFLDQSAGEPPVRGFLHRPETAPLHALILTHGAGANCESVLLVAMAQAFCAAGLTVLRCDLTFRQRRPHGPPLGTAKEDQAGLRRAVELLHEAVPGRVVLGGHSYGGRMASMLAAEDSSLCDGLLLLSYPLHPPRNPTQLRTAHFSNLLTPTLFVHGARDSFASEEEMQAALELIPGRTKLLEVEGAGHELIRKASTAITVALMVEAVLDFFALPLVSRTGK
jgi:uncharacterized protein